MSTDLSEFVTLSNTTLITDSQRVAKHFKKLHKNVLQACDKLDCSDEFRRLNFQPTMFEVPGPKGAVRQERMIQMTKNGFMFLVMGFTGKKPAAIKERYIGAFDEMAEQLQMIANDGFRSLWDQRLDLEKRDATSFMWASFGAQRMNDRKRELPRIREDRVRLANDMEPSLFTPIAEGAAVKPFPRTLEPPGRNPRYRKDEAETLGPVSASRSNTLCKEI